MSASLPQARVEHRQVPKALNSSGTTRLAKGFSFSLVAVQVLDSKFEEEVLDSGRVRLPRRTPKPFRRLFSGKQTGKHRLLKIQL